MQAAAIAPGKWRLEVGAGGAPLTVAPEVVFTELLVQCCMLLLLVAGEENDLKAAEKTRWLGAPSFSVCVASCSCRVLCWHLGTCPADARCSKSVHLLAPPWGSSLCWCRPVQGAIQYLLSAI